MVVCGQIQVAASGIPPESQMLRLVKENKIGGVVQLVGYQDIERTENLRRGLLFRNPRKFTVAKATSTVSNRSLPSDCPTMD
jgi:hypothetical protein